VEAKDFENFLEELREILQENLKEKSKRYRKLSKKTLPALKRTEAFLS